MKFKAWKNSIRVEKEYEKALNVLAGMFENIAKQCKGDVEAYRRTMEAFQKARQYEKYIDSVVRRMVTPVSVANMATWRQAAKKSTKGQFFYNLLRDEIEQDLKLLIEEQIQENINLIRTLPHDVADKVVHDISDEYIRGARAKSIEKVIIDKTSQHARASARLIARTEVNKTSSAITKARCQMLDLKWYVWRTALDGDRVRKSHRNMEDVLVSWANPPSPEKLVGEKDVGNYHAGNIWNCRCYAEPLIEIDDVKWPHKVYLNGQITRMSKHDFEQML